MSRQFRVLVSSLQKSIDSKMVAVVHCMRPAEHVAPLAWRLGTLVCGASPCMYRPPPHSTQHAGSEPVVASIERLHQILEEVVDVLEADGETHEPVVQPARQPHLARYHRVRHRRRVLDERLDRLLAARFKGTDELSQLVDATLQAGVVAAPR